MSEQTILDKLKTIGEWLFQNKDALRKEDINVQYAVLSPDDEGGAHVFGVYAINEDNLWHVMFDVLKEFYEDNDAYASFEDYMSDVMEQCLAWYEEEAGDADNATTSFSISYHPEDLETEEIGDLFGSEED